PGRGVGHGPGSAELFAQGLGDLVRKTLQTLRTLVRAHDQDDVMCALPKVVSGDLERRLVPIADESLGTDLDLARIAANGLAVPEERVALLNEAARIAGLVPA